MIYFLVTVTISFCLGFLSAAVLARGSS